MRQRRYLVTALILSVVIHGLVLAWLAPPAQQPLTTVTLDLVLIPELEPSSPAVDPPPPEEPPEQAPEHRPELEALANLAAEPLAPPPVVEPVPPTQETDPAVESVDAPRTVLNLQRPANWASLVEERKSPRTTIPFNPWLRERVTEREADRRRVALVAARAAAVYGSSDEQYTQFTGVGTEIKRDGGCAVLKEDRSVEEGTRWWASQCTDTRQNPLTLAPVEYDALGRVVAGEAR